MILKMIIIKCFIRLGQAFYAGGSERSGQQIIGPPKNRNNDKKVEQLFDAARKQGATEAQDNDAARKKNEKPFAGAGYSLGNIHSIKENQSIYIHR
jgi:UBX domain-containing protein 1